MPLPSPLNTNFLKSMISCGNTTLADSEPQKSGVRTQSGTATRRFSKSVKYVLKVSINAKLPFLLSSLASLFKVYHHYRQKITLNMSHRVSSVRDYFLKLDIRTGFREMLTCERIFCIRLNIAPQKMLLEQILARHSLVFQGRHQLSH